MFFHYIGKFSELSYVIKSPSGQERTAAEWNDVAEATRRRRDSFLVTGNEILLCIAVINLPRMTEFCRHF